MAGNPPAYWFGLNPREAAESGQVDLLGSTVWGTCTVSRMLGQEVQEERDSLRSLGHRDAGKATT